MSATPGFMKPSTAMVTISRLMISHLVWTCGLLTWKLIHVLPASLPSKFVCFSVVSHGGALESCFFKIPSFPHVMYVKKKKNYENANGKLGCHGEKAIQILLFYPRQTLNIDNKTAQKWLEVSRYFVRKSFTELYFSLHFTNLIFKAVTVIITTRVRRRQ